MIGPDDPNTDVDEDEILDTDEEDVFDAESDVPDGDLQEDLQITFGDAKDPSQHVTLSIMHDLSGGFHVYILKPDIDIIPPTQSGSIIDRGSILSYSTFGQYLDGSSSTRALLNAVDEIVEICKSRGAQEVAALGAQPAQRRLKVSTEILKDMKVTNFPDDALCKHLQAEIQKAFTSKGPGMSQTT